MIHLFTLFGDRHFEIHSECPLCGATRDEPFDETPCRLCGHSMPLKIREIREAPIQWARFNSRAKTEPIASDTGGR